MPTQAALPCAGAKPEGIESQMTPADEAVFSEFCQRFGRVTPPRQFGNPAHCSECEDANQRLLSLVPDDLDTAFLREPSRSWFLAWMGFEGFCYFLPGFCRVALERPRSDLSVLLDQLKDKWIASLMPEQTAALHALLAYCRDCGYASTDLERQALRSALQRTGAA